MKVVIIGSNGQLGSDLVNVLSEKHKVFGLNHDSIEVTDVENVRKVISEIIPDIIINTSAYHNVPECEKNPQKSFDVNTVGPLNIAKASNEAGAVFIHYSTDYVFDGSKKSPYIEDDIPNPLNIYGASKLAGEQLIKNYSEKFFIIRISGIYGTVPCRAKGGNFVYNIVKASKVRNEIKVVDDEILTPTPTLEIAKNTSFLMNTDAYGLYNMTCEGQCSWYDFTEAIFKKLGIKTPLYRCSSADMPVTVRRPFYSVLENSKLKGININFMSPWEKALDFFLKENSNL